MQSMVIAEGDQGRGSAFVLAMEGKVFLVTNSHVIRGNQNVKFKNLRNEEIATGPLQIADKVDVVRAEVTAAEHSLAIMPTVEQGMKIGDEILVAGNAEGEGVVREIPGKVVGIGPDRIEVDAPFVPGNSGSPILLKSTGEVIGVATFLRISSAQLQGATSPFSLNEVRKFGYRLDTVAKWISPAAQDRLAKEGLKLASMDELLKAVFGILNGNADKVAALGASVFIRHEQMTGSASFQVLAAAINEFAKKHAMEGDFQARRANVAAFFDKLKQVTLQDVDGFKVEHFSGFYAVQFKEHLTQLKRFHEWFGGTSMPLFRDYWMTPTMNATSNPPNLNRGLVAFWDADGTALDSSAGGFSGELLNVTFGGGVQGQSISFTSDDAAVVMDESTLQQNYSALSISTWVNARSHGQADYDNYGRAIISRTEDGGFALRVFNGRIQFDLRLESGEARKMTFAHPPLPLNTWVHLCVTYDGKAARAYVNGLSLGYAATVSGRIKKTTRPTARLMIGNEPGVVPDDPNGVIQPGRFGWDGQVDQLAVHDRALDDAEVSLLYQLTGPKPSGPRLPLLPDRITGTKWSSGAADFWIEFRANGDYREFWRGGEYPGTWKVLNEKEISVSRKDGWDYLFKPIERKQLLRVWKPKPGQEKQREEVFQRMTGSRGNSGPAPPAAK